VPEVGLDRAGVDALVSQLQFFEFYSAGWVDHDIPGDQLRTIVERIEHIVSSPRCSTGGVHPRVKPGAGVFRTPLLNELRLRLG
jgi:hypothetical protein